MLVNLLTELGISIAIGQMQRPTGKALIKGGKALRVLGREMEDLGEYLVKTAPPGGSPPAGPSAVATGCKAIATRSFFTMSASDP